MLLRILSLFVLVHVASAATWSAKLEEKPAEFADKQGCYIKEINDVIPFGTDVSPIGVCHRIECSGVFLHYASCGLSMFPKNCHASDDLTKPYPDCCASIVECDEDNVV